MSDEINMLNPLENPRLPQPLTFEQAFELLSDEKKDFHRSTPEDWGIIAKIDHGMGEEDFNTCYKFSIKNEFYQHYISLQTAWIKREEEMLEDNKNKGRVDRRIDITEDMTQQRTCPRFRAYYCMKYPERVRYKPPSGKLRVVVKDKKNNETKA
jgi:hypothetical protein